MVVRRENWLGHRKLRDQEDEDVVNLANKDYGQATWKTLKAKNGKFAHRGAVQMKFGE